jgi:hypothetical protein
VMIAEKAVDLLRGRSRAEGPTAADAA